MAEPFDNGGQAFPRAGFSGPRYAPPVDGMSLRVWFAGQALAGMAPHHSVTVGEAEAMSRSAYIIADAMIAARKGGAQ